MFAATWLSSPDDSAWDPECDISYPYDAVIDESDLTLVADDWLERGETVPETPENIAEGKEANQSSTYVGGVASRAVDGNTGGDFGNGSVTHTAEDLNAWWEVDLGSVYEIESIEIWNRTGATKFTQRLDDFYVFVSDVPFESTDLMTTMAQDGVQSHRITTAPDPSASLSVGGTGQYVRIQLTGTNYLNLAEVKVLGRQ